MRKCEVPSCPVFVSHPLRICPTGHRNWFECATCNTVVTTNDPPKKGRAGQCYLCTKEGRR